MADSNRVRGSIAGDCEGEAGRRGKRGHRGHRGPQGPIGPTGPAGQEGFAPFPDNAPLITRIFVRIDGDDANDGTSEETAFRTVQHAFTTLPHVIQPGQAIIVDCTGIGIENFPAGYQMPEVHGAALIQSVGTTPPFIFLASLNVWATPQPASNVPVADTTVPSGYLVTADPVTNLATITVGAPIASWAGDSLQGKMLISDTVVAGSGVIYASDTTHLFTTIDASQVGGTLSIVEPSATFQTPTAGADGTGFEAADITSLSFGGIAFTCLDGSLALGIMNTSQPILELCDIGGLETENVPEQVLPRSSVLRNGLDIEASSFTPSRSLMLDLGFAVFGDATVLSIRSVWDGTQFAIGPTPVFTATGTSGFGTWEFLQVLIRNSTAADAAVLCQGYGSFAFENVLIQGSAGDAIRAQDQVSLALTNVQGGTGGVSDPANAGYGLQLLDGAQARIFDDATVVTGSAEGPNSDLKVGVLPVRPWSDFRNNAPIKNQFDLSTPFSFNALSGLTTPAGEETYPAGPTTPGGGSSGSRAFQRP